MDEPNPFQADDVASWDELRGIVSTVTDMVVRMSDNPAALALIAEQVQAVVRDQMLGIGCDPNNEAQLRATLLGAMLVMNIQIDHTAVPVSAAMVPIAVMERLKNVDSLDGWDTVAEALMQMQSRPAQPVSRLGRLVRRLLA